MYNRRIEMLVDLTDHQRGFFAVDLPQSGNMRIKVIFRQKAVADQLRKDCGMYVGGLLGHRQFGNNLFGRYHIPHPQARG